MRDRRSLRRFILIAAVFATLASGCSDDTESTAEVATSSTQPPPTTTAEPVNDAPTTTSAEDEQNFASFRGVTEDSIKVGVTVPDFDALQAAGLPNYQGDNRIAFQAFFDQINDAGGIHGRMIEPVYADFSFVDAASQDTACSELAEDAEVFIVLFGLLADSNLCFTELNETMVMTFSYQTIAARSRSGDTLWLQEEAADEAEVDILGSAVAGAGHLEGATVGILASAATGGLVVGEALEQTLSRHGHESTIYLAEDTAGDGTARDAMIQRLAQRMAADGVDFLFNLGGGGTWTEDLADAGFHPPRTAYLVLNTDTEAASDKTLLAGGLAVGSVTPDDVWADPEFQEICIAPILAAYPELTEEFSYLPDSDQQATGERNWLTQTRSACNQTRLLTQLGEIAGADLTNDSFRAALDELGPVELLGYGQASFTSAGKWDGLDEFYLQEYDVETDSLQIIGDAIVVDR
ncbi:MAG: ABC transporter substrate-binding protein [Acidimicrobiales bacterium]|nr:ABC transporter substrate-binding protein [Acidimicrobiales bacterium]